MPPPWMSPSWHSPAAAQVLAQATGSSKKNSQSGSQLQPLISWQLPSMNA